MSACVCACFCMCEAEKVKDGGEGGVGERMWAETEGADAGNEKAGCGKEEEKVRRTLV